VPPGDDGRRGRGNSGDDRVMRGGAARPAADPPPPAALWERRTGGSRTASRSAVSRPRAGRDPPWGERLAVQRARSLPSPVQSRAHRPRTPVHAGRLPRGAAARGGWRRAGRRPRQLLSKMDAMHRTQRPPASPRGRSSSPSGRRLGPARADS
jgi:hypothetical protein